MYDNILVLHGNVDLVLIVDNENQYFSNKILGMCFYYANHNDNEFTHAKTAIE